MPVHVDTQLEVFLRVRPMAAREKKMGATQIAFKVDNKVVCLMDPSDNMNDVLRQNRSREKTYIYDCTFGPESTQVDVFERTTKHLLQRVLQGFNSTVFAYGATGAGKTYTMLGTDGDAGIMARAMRDLFQYVDDDSEESKYDIRMSYLEIYNEKIRDLLVPKSKELDLREDSNGDIVVAGLSEVKTKSDKQLLALLLEGNKRRTQEPTAANETSSRSHAILQVTVTRRNKVKNLREQLQIGKLFLIDLAGSERASMTQNQGKRLQEGAHINRSLLALANVINGLTSTDRTPKYVNYRDSKLTRLLKDSLGGNSKTIMIANISPASIHFEESRNTLIYADRAKNITTKVRQNSHDVNHHVSQYQSIISELRKEISRLKDKIDEDGVTPRSSRGRTSLGRSSSDLSSNIQPSPRNLLNPADGKLPKMNPSENMDENNKQRDVFHKLKEDLIENYETQKQLRYTLMNINDAAFTIAATLSSKKAALRGWDLQRGEREDPPNVVQLRKDVDSLSDELESLEQQKGDLEVQLKQARKEERKLEKEISKVSSNSERKQIFSLLSKMRELEAEKAAFQSDALILNRRLERNTTSLKKVEEFNSLADHIIMEQQESLKGLGTGGDKEALLQDYKNLKYQTKYHMLPLDDKAQGLAEKSWNRSIFEKEFQQNTNNGRSGTLSGNDLKVVKSVKSRQNSEINMIRIVPKVDKGSEGRKSQAIDDSAVDYRKVDQRLQNIKLIANERANERRSSKGSIGSNETRSSTVSRGTNSSLSQHESLPEIEYGSNSRQNSVKSVKYRPRSSSNLPPIQTQLFVGR